MKKTYNIVDRKVVETEADHGAITVYINPDEQEKKYLVEELKVDEHTFSSALDPDELARLEFEPDHAAVIYKRPKNYSAAEQFLFGVSSAGVFLYGDRLRIILPDDAVLFEGPQFSRVTSLAGVILRLLARAVIHFREHLRIINRVSDELQQAINRSMENRNLINMFSLEKSLVYYVNSLNSNAALLEKLRNNAAKIGFTTEELEYLDDLIIENNQCSKQAEMYSNIIASLMDARASVVANNLNVLMKTLNLITIAIMVPTLVVSIFSMNVRIPLEQHPHAFWMIVGLAGVAVATFLLIWRRRRW